jgi:hypothetical protein
MQRFLSAYRWNMDRYAWLMGHADVPVGSGVEGLISLMPQENQSQPLPVAKMDHFDFGGQRYLVGFGKRKRAAQQDIWREVKLSTLARMSQRSNRRC